MKDESDLRKEVGKLVSDLHRMAVDKNLSSPSIEIVHFALVSAKIARIQDIASQRTEALNRKLFWLTAVLAVLTVALLVFTVVLYKDTHALVARDKAQQHHNLQTTKPPEPKP